MLLVVFYRPTITYCRISLEISRAKALEKFPGCRAAWEPARNENEFKNELSKPKIPRFVSDVGKLRVRKKEVLSVERAIHYGGAHRPAP
jgi:hypothetical protein